MSIRLQSWDCNQYNSNSNVLRCFSAHLKSLKTTLGKKKKPLSSPKSLIEFINENKANY